MKLLRIIEFRLREERANRLIYIYTYNGRVIRSNTQLKSKDQVDNPVLFKNEEECVKDFERICLRLNTTIINKEVTYAYTSETSRDL